MWSRRSEGRITTSEVFVHPESNFETSLLELATCSIDVRPQQVAVYLASLYHVDVYSCLYRQEIVNQVLPRLKQGNPRHAQHIYLNPASNAKPANPAFPKRT